MTLSRSEFQYILEELKKELEWYKKSMDLLSDEIGVSANNKRVGDIYAQMKENKELVESRVQELERHLSTSK